VHSPYKQPLGSRLARRALAVIYQANKPGLNIDPRIANATAATKCGKRTVLVTLDGVQGASLQLNGKLGFEVSADDGVWHSTSVSLHSQATLLLSLASLPAQSQLVAVRYLWYASPCGTQPFGCAVYARVPSYGPLSGEQLGVMPVPPYIGRLVHASAQPAREDMQTKAVDKGPKMDRT
jgi:hypothetical protein